MRTLPIAALICVAVSAAAAGGKPTSGTTDPALGYIRVAPSGAREIRLAAEDGTGSVALVSTRNRNTGFSLSPRSLHQIVYSDGNAVKLLTYDITSTGPRTTGIVSLIDFGRTASPYVDFAPNGASVGWYDPRDKGIYRYDLATSQKTLVVTLAGDLDGFEFNFDSSKIIYAETEAPTYETQFKSAPATGGSAINLPIRGAYGDFNVGHSDDRIVVDTMGDMNGAITLFPADGGFSSRLTNGSFPALRCDDQVIAFQLRTSTGVSLLKYDITTGLTSTFSSSGTNMSPDYFPDC